MDWEQLTAKESLRADVIAIKDIGGGEHEIDAAIARNVLHEELGYYKQGVSWKSVYELDGETRDRLIVHGRQDTSHSLIINIRMAKRVRRGFRILILMNIAIIILLILILLKY